jgi:cytochrome c oxidase subunit 1
MTAIQSRWRQCQVTGLQIDPNSERLFMFNAVTAVLWLAFGGTLALLIALTRWDAIHLIDDSEWFYRLVGAHGAAMLVFWIIFFEVAALIFGGTILLNTRFMVPTLGWISYGLMLIGSLVMTFEMLNGSATVMFTAYPPLEASSWFYLAFILFAVGALIAVVHFIVNVVAARWRGEIRSLPLFSFALLAAAIIAIFSLVSGAIAIVPLWLKSVGVIDYVDPGVYRLMFWGLGHGAQQINLAAMVGVWYALASLTVGAKPLNEGLSRFAFLLYICFINMGAIHHILVDPGLGNWMRGFNTSYFVYAAVLGSMIHAFTIPASIEVALREKGFARGLFDWLKNAPWKEPGFSALVLSLIMFGVLGGISGVIMGGFQINMLAHNTLTVPAHFHMTVVAGTTLAFMGITYYIVPLIFRRELFLSGLAKVQPWLYGGGMLIFGIGMGFAGHLEGVPRRHFDISFPNLPVSLGIYDSSTVDLYLTIMGIGAILAVTGGAMFIIIAAGTVFLAKRAEMPDIGKVDPEAFAIPAVAGGSGLGEAENGQTEAHAHDPNQFEAPGTFFIAVAFLALFMLLYAYSWFELSDIPWKIA